MHRLKIKVPNWVKFIAKDEDDRVFYYPKKPRFNGERREWRLNGVVEEAPFSLDGPWDQSLYEVVKDDKGFIVDLKKYDPRCELRVDDKVIVGIHGLEAKRHFSHFDPRSDGIYTFDGGKTSFSSGKRGSVTRWTEWRKA